MTALEHVYNVLEIDHSSRMILADHGVKDHGKLLMIAEDLQNGEPKELNMIERRTIIRYFDWSRAFIDEHQRKPEPLQDFTSVVFEEYQQKRFVQQPDLQFEDLYRSGERHAMKALSSDEVTKKVYDVVVNCAKQYPFTGQGNPEMKLDELVEEYNDLWDRPIAPSLMKLKLNYLTKNGHVKKVTAESGGDAWVLNEWHGRGSKKQRT